MRRRRSRSRRSAPAADHHVRANEPVEGEVVEPGEEVGGRERLEGDRLLLLRRALEAKAVRAERALLAHRMGERLDEVREHETARFRSPSFRSAAPRGSPWSSIARRRGR